MISLIESQADVHLAFSEQLHRASAALGELDLRFHRVGDAELLQGLVETDACRGAARGLGIGNGFRSEEKPLDCIRARDVGLRRARSHGDANGNEGKRRLARGYDMPDATTGSNGNCTIGTSNDSLLMTRSLVPPPEPKVA